MFASNQNNTLCMHVITEIVAAWSVRIYLPLDGANMASNKVTLVDLEDKKQFLFNYKKKISGFKFIRWGNNREAVVRSRVEKRIKPYDSCAFEKFMQEKTKEKDLKCDFWYSKEEGDKILRSSGITITCFASLKGVYFCRHLRDHRRDYRWLEVTFFSLKNTPIVGKMIKLANCSLKKASSSHLVKFRAFNALNLSSYICVLLLVLNSWSRWMHSWIF